MIFSHKVELAIAALSELVGREKEWVLARDISQSTGIPLPYLHKILHTMGQAGLIVSKRGYHGGITLARPAGQISLLDVLQLSEGDGWAYRCPLKNVPCKTVQGCPIHGFWDRTRKGVADYFSGITLEMMTGLESENGQATAKKPFVTD